MCTGAINIVVESSVAAAAAGRATRRVCEVAAMFGLGVDPTRRITIVPRTTLCLAPGRVLFVTGASGGGKSTLLRLIAQAVSAREGVRLVDFGRILESTTETQRAQRSGEDGDRSAEAAEQAEPAIVERVGRTLEEAVRYLALAGINDAFVMLRRASELSDGQRYRLRLALAMEDAERGRGLHHRAAAGAEKRGTGDGGARELVVVMADEFGAALDRLTAQVIARNVRKWASRSGVCFIAATTHDDLLEALDPDVLIVQEPGERMALIEREMEQ